MPVYVWRDGFLIDRALLVGPANDLMRSALPAPSVHGFTTYASPIDGQSISSHRQRDRDLDRSGSYDPRETPLEFRKAADARKQRQRREPSK